MMDIAATTLTYAVPAYVRAAEIPAIHEEVRWPIKLPAVSTDAATSRYTAILPGNDFAAHFSKLKAIETDSTLWPEGAEGPSREALLTALSILRHLQADTLPPTRVVASAEGGVAICFVSGDKYSDIECLNNGTILGVTSNRRDRPRVWEVKQSPSDLTRAAARIREFLLASTPRENASKRQETR